MPNASPVPVRFWAKVDTSGDCWVWTASQGRRGYGQLGVDGRTRPAHRISWELAYGPIPTGLSVLHRCDNPPCVRPDHLFLGTYGDNARDAAAKGRMARGARQACARLDDGAVREIRQLLASGHKQKAIAHQFNVTKATISAIHIGRSWGWLQ